MTTSTRVISSIKFAHILEGSGLVQDADRITKIVITADPSDLVKIEVTYVADERLLNLLAPKSDSKEVM